MSGERPIKTPHLPSARVRLAAIGEAYRQRLEAPLQKRGVEVLWLPENKRVDPRLSGHADLALLHLGGKRLVTAEESIANYLTNRGFEVLFAEKKQSAAYPNDCGLCGLLLGNKLIGRLDALDKSVTENLPDGIELINISQGYAKCSICAVDVKSVITSDAGVIKNPSLDEIAALQVTPGFIELPGFKEGFLGGAAFKLSCNELAFTGTLEQHPDKARIEAFLRERDIEPVYLTDDAIFDIGSAVLLTESDD